MAGALQVYTLAVLSFSILVMVIVLRRCVSSIDAIVRRMDGYSSGDARPQSKTILEDGVHLSAKGED